MSARGENGGSLAFWLFAAVGAIMAGFLAYRMVVHHMPVALVVFACFSSWSGIHFGLNHLFAAFRRAQQVVREVQR